MIRNVCTQSGILEVEHWSANSLCGISSQEFVSCAAIVRTTRGMKQQDDVTAGAPRLPSCQTLSDTVRHYHAEKLRVNTAVITGSCKGYSTVQHSIGFNTRRPAVEEGWAVQFRYCLCLPEYEYASAYQLESVGPATYLTRADESTEHIRNATNC